jgi:type I restriction enzyme, R subunit
MIQARIVNSEALTRAERIDRQLAKAGWAVSSRHVIEELWLPADPVMAEPPPRRLRAEFVDYALMTPDGRPIAIVEAKKSSRDPLVGERQAADYADRIKASIPSYSWLTATRYSFGIAGFTRPAR